MSHVTPIDAYRRCKYCGTENIEDFNYFNTTLCMTCSAKLKRMRATKAPKKYCKMCHNYVYEEFFREKDSDTCLMCYNNGYYDHDIWNVDREKKDNGLTDIIKEAHNLGISYGQYVARYHIK